MNPDLTLISVSYKSAALFLSSWKAFLESTGDRIIIVDNASPDGSGLAIARAFPGLQVLQAGSNLGYGRAANLALSQCRSRFALLLNPDLLVSEDTVSRLYSAAMHDPDETAIWAPAITAADFSDSTPRTVETAHGAALLFDLHRLQQVGLFDENFFLYCEESDLCYRTRSHGFQIKLVPRVLMAHQGGESSGDDSSLLFMKSWHFGWSRCYYLGKHALNSSKRSPSRLYRNYRLQSLINLNRRNRLRYRGQAAGVRAFIRGEKAFSADGTPQHYPG